MTGARDRILARIRAAGRSASPATANAGGPVQPAIAGDLHAAFEAAAVGADGEVVGLAAIDAVPAAVAAALAGEKTVGIAPVERLTDLDWSGAGLQTSHDRDAEACVVVAFAGIAETGTVVLVSDEAPTDASFLTDHLLVVVDRDTITAWQETVWQRLEARYGQVLPRGVILMTGPSRTGDVEQTLQLGAHGPRRLTLLMI